MKICQLAVPFTLLFAACSGHGGNPSNPDAGPTGDGATPGDGAPSDGSGTGPVGGGCPQGSTGVPFAAVGIMATRVVTADFNGDGIADLATASDEATANVSVALGLGDGLYAAPTTYLVGTGEASAGAHNQIVAGDFDGDGHPDLAAINTGSATITVLLGSASGALHAGAPIAITGDVGDTPHSLLAGDWNKDGVLDLAIGTTTVGNPQGKLAIYVGDGTGGFAAPQTFKTSGTPSQLVAADFDGDGRLDLVVVNEGQPMDLFLGQGHAAFTKQTTVLPIGYAAAVGDFNGDTHADLAFISGGTTLGVMLGDGTGAFGTPSTLGAESTATAITAADLDGDGKLDLVTNGIGGVATLKGHGDGTFATAVVYASEYVQGGTSFVVADLTGDKRADLAWTASSDEVQLLVNHADTGFLQPHATATAAHPTSLTAGDFNGDGKPDVAVATATGAVSIMLDGADGTLGAHKDVSTGGSAAGLVSADLDGDGKLDVVVVSTTGVYTLLGKGDGTFGNAVKAGGTGLGFDPYLVAVGDFTGDGKPDVAVVDGGSTPYNVVMSPGNGDGTLGVEYTVTMNQAPLAIAIADFDKDGSPDIVLGVATGFVVAYGNGDGTFQKPVFTVVAGDVAGIAVADLDGDGKLDLVASTNAGIAVLKGTGSGKTAAAVVYASGGTSGAPAIAITDFDGDGKLDVVTAGGNAVDLLLGNGDGTLRAVRRYPAQLDAVGIAAGDLDGDGHRELITADGEGSVVLALSPACAP